MFNSTILDIAIGLAFTYLLLALICTTINEWIAGVLKTRGKMLVQGLAGLLKEQSIGSTNLLAAFQAHPLIAALQSKPGSPPSYIASRTFALTVMDLITPQQPGPITFADLQTGINNLPPGCVRSALLAIIQNVRGDVGVAQARIEDWFNDAMDRVSGWYTRRSQLMAFVIAVVLTVAVNADTLAIGNKLWISPTLRQQVVKRAQASGAELKDLITARYSDPANPKPSKPTVQTPVNPDGAAVRRLQSQLGDLVGWPGDGNIPSHIPGWILTIIAVSLGAPFWFDTLNRFMSVRAAGKSPAETEKAGK
jgi:hypothetical protein